MASSRPQNWNRSRVEGWTEKVLLLLEARSIEFSVNCDSINLDIDVGLSWRDMRYEGA